MERFLYVSLGAIVGANARYLMGLWAAERFGVAFPYGTMIVNITGCFLIGVFNGLGEMGLAISPNVRLLFTVGFLGAYTTFSSFGFESVALMRVSGFLAASLNITINVVVGLAAVVLGLYAARIFQVR
ncbi:MAG TPA: fluoride efflux transporter CrcB [Chloroflexi bacterium]|nr:fluoride efflux transporter CrcB [Chloroflexota bacterium]